MRLIARSATLSTKSNYKIYANCVLIYTARIYPRHFSQNVDISFICQCVMDFKIEYIDDDF